MTQIDRLLGIMQRLRDPENGCPWDKEQTFSTIAPYTLEETYEVLDAIAREDFDDLRGELGDLDLTFASYKGHLVTCVGSTVCKIGMVDSPAVAERLAVALDRHLPPDTHEKRALLRLVTDELRISGCPNACASHHTARLGIGCLNQKVEGEVQPFARLFTGAGVRDGVPRFSKEAEPARLIPVAELAETVIAELLKIAAEDAAR